MQLDLFISKNYIKEYVKNKKTRAILEQCDCFMNLSYSLKEISAAAQNLSNFAKHMQVSKSMHSRVIAIVYSRLNSYNLFTFIAYWNDIRNSGLNLIGSIDKKLAFLMIFSIKKNSNIVLFFRRFF